jgi:hypothetical protein
MNGTSDQYLDVFADRDKLEAQLDAQRPVIVAAEAVAHDAWTAARRERKLDADGQAVVACPTPELIIALCDAVREYQEKVKA